MAPTIIGFQQDWKIRVRGYEGQFKFLRKLSNHVGYNSKLSDELGKKALELLSNQISSFQDMDGKRFSKYGKSYAKSKNVSPDSVNMELSSDMIKSLYIVKKFEYNKTLILIRPRRRLNQVKAWVHHTGAISGRRRARFRMPRRRWFGIQKKNVKILKEMARQELLTFLEREGGQQRLF